MTETEVTYPTLTDGDVTVWFEDIGPSRADELLKTYKVDYRKFRPSYAEGLARDMENGNWNFDGSPIRIDIEENLFDGQHRLNAVRKSKTTQRFCVIAGLPVKAYDTTDSGLARTYADSLRRRGYNNVSMRTALIKLIDRWNNGLSLGDTKRRTPPELDAVHNKNMDSINWAISNTVSTSYKVDMPPAMVAFAWWSLGQLDTTDCKTFMVGVAEGENLRKGQPIYTLRERLRNDAEERYTRNEYAHLTFQAWNAFRDSKELTRLQFPSGLVSRDNMAVPR
ncbi:hypothetical protein ACIBI9_31235 [Nonomuraea sp. NPDC050451]|uniref:hypothetical protein n=1 Tax=Nonomuraea sp. NPDC050451 TaxID=3364364 RepID=UPI0037B24BE7